MGMATDGNDDLLNKPICQFTLEELRRVGIVDIDNFKVSDSAPAENQYAVRLARSDLEWLAQLLLQPASAAARKKAAPAKKKPAAKKAPAKTAAGKSAARKSAPAKKSGR
jgi:hypothetical protein